ncbi:MAG TPA: ATP-dependent DNA ligase [Actinomycetota bacterium]|nr:ATP-dependent DNA ligase [Actinomycetota bacterium]
MGTTLGTTLLSDLATTSEAVAATPGRRAKIGLLAATLRRLAQDEAAVAVAYLSGAVPQGALGVGWASVRDLPPAQSAPPSVTILDLDATFARLAATAGTGSQAARRSELHALFSRLTSSERRFVLGLLSGELRQGAQAGVVTESVAQAAGVPTAELRRALLLAGDLPAVAGAALAHGSDGLRQFRLEVLRPLKPMLAQSVADPAAALARICPAAVEWKFDGVRIQVHRLDATVRAFSRTLADVTPRVPELVRAIQALPTGSLILDGELLALRPDGRPRPFQETMSRFGTQEPAAARPGRIAGPVAGTLAMVFFDCLHADGEDLIDLPAEERFAALRGLVPADVVVPHALVADAPGAEACLDAALAAGHEGVMVKDPAAPYEAGRRGAAWLKVKRAHTLDLVVLAAEWGHGRRRGWLSNLHLGARGPGGTFVMLGKTFKGMSDAVLAWQTAELLAREVRRDEWTVYVRPELVVEVAFDGIQSSSRYPGGVALRFARIKGYRTDKPAAGADTIETIRSLST